MNSCLYECKTYHQRISPKGHQFSYRYFTFLLDLDELEDLHKKLRLFSLEKLNLFSFRQTDHNLKDKKTLRESLKGQLEKIDPSLEIQKVFLLTSLRTIGHLFNPVSFYFIHTQKGKYLIAEVMNTFYEFKNFLVENGPENTSNDSFQAVLDKNFYISPFSTPIGQIRFNVHWPDENLNILIQNLAGEKLSVSANLLGKKRTLSDLNLLWMFIKYPLVTIKVLLAIHYQAFLLFIKKLPYTKKDQFIDFQTETDLWKIKKK